jgi:uncharacterized integral membrane protein
MDAYVLAVALTALAVAVTALVRSGSAPETHSPLQGSEIALRPISRPYATRKVHAAGAARVARPPDTSETTSASVVVRIPCRTGPPPPRMAGAAEWLLSAVPTACGLGAIGIVITTFLLQNRHTVAVHFLDWHFERIPLALAIAAAAIVAVSGSTLLSLLNRRKLRTRIQELERFRDSWGRAGGRQRPSGDGKPGTGGRWPRARSGQPFGKICS